MTEKQITEALQKILGSEKYWDCHVEARIIAEEVCGKILSTITPEILVLAVGLMEAIKRVGQ